MLEEIPDREPLQVAIVTGGQGDVKWFKWELERAGQNLEEWDFTDVSKDSRKDPKAYVGHMEDRTHDQTVMTVTAQDNFSEVVCRIIEKCKMGRTKQWLNCYSGWRRASVIGATTESNLSSLAYTTDATTIIPQRIFQAQGLAFHKRTSNNAYREKFGNIVEWRDNPWGEVAGPQCEKELFGYRACSGSAKAHEHWQELNFKIDALSFRI